ncbi:type I-U CRISPR-associated helicase/endonuclease Cas3 [Chloracidobacterium thermophilum]|uniref:DEAD/DEAH box helicase n=1 Tax=Chloracidobacterium thermophilum TaxID=458033 RepID=UPI0007399826|nr:type I-U CRISPR-associated helicase/endonuclease Cas3 [Chloracidobacterium thermophilum]
MSTDRGQGWLKKALGLTEGEAPFPWQMELLRRFRCGKAISSLDIPTGLGKTSVMAIWLVARALKAKKLPRRLVYVVDRRAVVDQATEVAESLREWVAGDQCVADTLGLGGRPLPISTLRGQYVDNREWLEDPSLPAIIVGTVDMIGSRLLFKGYGVSRKMQSYHAGLLGADTLFVLDEAHLVPPFEHLLRTIEKDFAPRAPVPPLRVLSLSATSRTQGDNVFKLTEEDSSHCTVKKRLEAKKLLQIKQIATTTNLEDALAESAWKLSCNGNKPVRILVYADSREVARKAKEAVEKRAKDSNKQGKPEVKIETELFVGGRRVFEREGAKKRLEELGFLAGSKVERTCPVFLFATSAGEVGVDLDADHMVCDLVAWERMVQRLGRVNRRGDGDARVIVVVKDCEDRVAQYCALLEIAREGGSLSPKSLLKLRECQNLASLFHEATTPEPLRPELTRPLVDAWAMRHRSKSTPGVPMTSNRGCGAGLRMIGRRRGWSGGSTFPFARRGDRPAGRRLKLSSRLPRRI